MNFNRYPLSADCTSNDVLVGAYPPGIINLESRNRLSNSSLNALFFDTKQGDVEQADERGEKKLRVAGATMTKAMPSDLTLCNAMPRDDAKRRDAA